MSRPFLWDGVVLPVPSIDWGVEDISTSDSGRNLSGLMDKKDVAQKTTLDTTWELVPDTIASLILSTVKSETFGSLNYPDPRAGGNITKTMYSGAPKAKMMATLGGVCYWSIGISFIEQ